MVAEEELKGYFEDFGAIADVKIRSSKRDVFAFIEFKEADEAAKAIAKADQSVVCNCRVKVHYAQTRGSNSFRSRSGEGGVPNELNQLWVGHLKNSDEDKLKSAFEKYGEIKDIKIRSNRQGLFAFIEFESKQAGEDAIKGLDQTEVCGGNIAVAWAKEKSGRRRERSYSRRRSHSRGRRSYSRGRRSYSRGRRRRSYSRDRYRRRRSYSRDRGYGRMRARVPKGDYKIELENLPPDMTWGDLKSLARKYTHSFNDVTFTRTWQDGRVMKGIVELIDQSSVDRIIDELDGKRINEYKVRVKEIR